MITKQRKYKTQRIPEQWFIDSIKRGNLTTEEIIEDLGIGRASAYYRLRELLDKEKIKRDTNRLPFYYYIDEQ